MPRSEKAVYGTWTLYGDAIQQKRDELHRQMYPPSPKITPDYDVPTLFAHRVLDEGLAHGGQGFDMDRLFRRLVNEDVGSEVALFEQVLFDANRIFQSQDLG